MVEKAIDIRNFDFEDFVHREFLDFEEDLSCASTLSKRNLEVCLSCGKAFKGGSISSPAVKHFIDTSHLLFIRLSDGKILRMPEEIPLPSMPEFDDICFSANPVYDKHILYILEEKRREGCKLGPNLIIYPGFYSLFTLLKANLELSTIRFLSSIDPIRDYLLLNTPQTSVAKPLAEFFTRFFNPFPLKPIISSTYLLNSISALLPPDVQHQCSINPSQYLSFLLNSLSLELGPKAIDEHCRNGINISILFENQWHSKSSKIWFIPLELSDSPLYRDGREKEEIIPKTKLSELLARYDGKTITNVADGHGGKDTKKMSLRKSREYIIMNVSRFRDMGSEIEKNRMHIVLPLGSLDMRPYGLTESYELHAVLAHEGEGNHGKVNISGEITPATNNEFVVYQRIKSTGKWFKCYDSHVSPCDPTAPMLADSCLLMYQKV